MPSSDTSSSSWSESDAEESTSSSSLANDASSVLEGSTLSTDEEFGSTAEGEEVDASPRDSLRKWALRLKIPHAHVNELLKALKPWLPGLPADARTLLGTKYVSAPSTAMVSEVFNRWNKDHHSDRQQLEHAFKNAFKKGHDRYQRKCQRASTSRKSQDPSRTNTDPEVDKGDNQQ
ncbi:hypothetical protein SprV_0602240200 [Sparganum proliferum]